MACADRRIRVLVGETEQRRVGVGSHRIARRETTHPIRNRTQVCGVGSCGSDQVELKHTEKVGQKENNDRVTVGTGTCGDQKHRRKLLVKGVSEGSTQKHSVLHTRISISRSHMNDAPMRLKSTGYTSQRDLYQRL